MASRAWAVLAVLVACAMTCRAQPTDKVQILIDWVKAHGGMVKAEVKVDANGVRGLYATEDVPEGENIVSIPSSVILNAGGLGDSFAVPTLTVLRELKSEHSRFKPYVDVWPKPNEVLNSCNMPSKYIPMWKSDYWEQNTVEWQQYLEHLHTGRLNPDLEITVPEAVGNITVTLQDLEYACAVSSTRYVSASRRKRLIMAPVYDMANHKRECEHSINQYEESDFLHIIAGAPVKRGEELCYSYGALRDDYAVAHYGFVPDLEDPPRLSLVDHRDFKGEDNYSHDDAPAEEPFVGTQEEMEKELVRVQTILDKLLGTPDKLPVSPPGQDYIYDTLKLLEQRRIGSLTYEVERIKKHLASDKSEL